MGRLTRYVALPDQSYDPRVTDMSKPLRPPKGTLNPDTGEIVKDQYRNRNVSNTTPIQLVGNAASIRVLPNNPRRTGLLIQNKDATNVLYYGFGQAADINSLSLAAGGVLLLDFTTPNSEVWFFATANIQTVVTDISRGT